MRRLLVTVAMGLGAVAGPVWLAAPASATCTSGCTTLSTTVVAGTLSMSVASAGTTVTLSPASGSAVPLAQVSAALGQTSVTDSRAASTGWTASATTTDFSNGTNTISMLGNATLTPTGAPATCGTGDTFAAVNPVALNSGASSPGVAEAKCSAVGANSAAWGETFTLTLPATAAAGTYTATITQSVQ